MNAKLFLFASIVLQLSGACGSRNTDLPPVEGTPIASQAEIDRLKKQKQSDSDALNKERSTTQDQVNTLQVEIEKLSQELSANQKLSAEERQKIQTQLDDARRQKELAEQRQKELADKQAQLEKDLAAAKAAQANSANTNNSTSSSGAKPVSTTGGSAPSTTSTPKPTSTSTPTTPPANNLGTPSTTKHEIFYNTDCLAIGDGSSTEGALVYAKPCQKLASQTLAYEKLSNNTYRFIFQNSQKCLYVQGASSAEGAALQQLSCRRNGDTSELFVFADPANTYDFKLKNVRSGLCLKIASDGKIIQGNCATNYTIFRWRLSQ